jgi:acyl dehydratase
MHEQVKEFFEDFNIGDKFTSPYKTITDVEVNIFCILMGHASAVDNTRNIHMNSEYARNLGFKDRVVPGMQTLPYISLLMGQVGLWKQVILFLGLNNVRFTAPVYPGDSIKVECEVINKKEVSKWPDTGIITFKVIVKNQDEKVVLEAEASYQYRKKYAVLSK